KHNPGLLRFTTLSWAARDVDYDVRLKDITRQPSRPILSNMGVPAIKRDFYIHDTMAPEILHDLFPEARAAQAEEESGGLTGPSGVPKTSGSKAKQNVSQSSDEGLDFEMEEDEPKRK